MAIKQGTKDLKRGGKLVYSQSGDPSQLRCSVCKIGVAVDTPVADGTMIKRCSSCGTAFTTRRIS